MMVCISYRSDLTRDFASLRCYELPLDFRMVLRQETRVAHDVLDHAFTATDIADPDGFSAFVAVHLACFRAMRSRLISPNLSRATLDMMIAGLAQDAHVIGISEPAAMPPLADTIDPLAIDYMVAGSRLGSKVLKTRWAQSQNADVQRANAYFGQIADPALWPATCQMLATVPPDSPRAVAIVTDVIALFNYFMTVLDNHTAREVVTLD